MPKVLVGMSGGVDSSVCAELLLSSGYDVAGAIMKLYSNEDIGISKTKTCCSLNDVEDAKSVANRLGIDFFVFNFEDNFKEYVINNFCHSYLCGKTPNPCIECNTHMKFDAFLSRAQLLGYDYIATGHYAKIKFDVGSKRYLLLRSANEKKDQSYVLYTASQNVLSKTLFPLGDAKSKDDIRKIAVDKSLINASKPDSQDICFVPDGDYAAFIERYTNKKFPSGNYIDKNGMILGQHNGIIRYTIGQRKGLGISLGKRAFVVGKDIDTNTVTIGDETDLYSSALTCDEVNFIPFDKLTSPLHITAKTRYHKKDEAATIYPLDNGLVRCEFENPQRAVSKGQSVVFYDGDIVVGGGKIC